MNILLDYIFPISVIVPTPAASTAFLKQVALVCKPNGGGSAGDVVMCTTPAAVAAITDNTEASQLFTAGMSRVYIVLADDLDVATILAENQNLFYTLLISDDFDDEDVEEVQASGVVTISAFASLVSVTPDTLAVAGVTFTAQAGAAALGDAVFQAASSDEATAASLAAQINGHETASELVVATVVGDAVTIKAKDTGFAGNTIPVVYTDNNSPSVGLTLSGLSDGKLSGGAGLDVGIFTGVIGVWSDDEEWLAEQAVIENRVAFYGADARNLCAAFGKLLSNALNWTNQQYVTMPVSDGAETLGDANALFDERISFVIEDSEFGARLGLFAAGGKAIVAPYIIKNLMIDLQSRSLQWISGNQPSYTLRNATLLESDLQERVIDAYIDRQWIDAGTVAVALFQDNFVASGNIQVAEPKALWRVFSELRQNL